jgi:hypothetical protein
VACTTAATLQHSHLLSPLRRMASLRLSPTCLLLTRCVYLQSIQSRTDSQDMRMGLNPPYTQLF